MARFKEVRQVCDQEEGLEMVELAKAAKTGVLDFLPHTLCQNSSSINTVSVNTVSVEGFAFFSKWCLQGALSVFSV